MTRCKRSKRAVRESIVALLSDLTWSDLIAVLALQRLVRRRSYAGTFTGTRPNR